LHPEHVALFKGWIKPKVHHDYYWFTDEEHKQQQIAEFIALPKKWFWQK